MGVCREVGREKSEIRYRASKSKDRTSGVFERGQRIDWTIAQK